MTADFVELGRRLRALRLAAGQSQAELAATVGLDRTTLGKIEHGKIPPVPSADLIARLVAACLGDEATRSLVDELIVLSGRVPPDLIAWLLATPGAVAAVRQWADTNGHELGRPTECP